MHDFIARVWALIVHLFSASEAAAVQFGKEVLSEIAQAGGQLFIDVIEDAVYAAEQQGGTGTQKFEAAVTAARESLAEKGIEVANNLINAAIEMAVAKLKARLADPDSGDAAPAQPAQAQEPAAETPAAAS